MNRILYNHSSLIGHSAIIRLLRLEMEVGNSVQTC